MRTVTLRLACIAPFLVSLAVACSDDSTEPGAAASDASVDGASPVDSGGVDASAGNDAGTQSDASTVDSGTDSGPVDAGPVCDVSPCVVEIAVGYRHACARLVDGTVRCWGANQFGSLGAVTAGSDGGFDASAQATPVAVLGLTDVVSISSGIYHSCALTNAGAVWCWGANSSDQIGSPDAGAVFSTPHALAFSGPVAELVAGGYRTCVRTTAGNVECVGDNGNGQIGGGDAAPPNAPAQIATPTAMVGVSSAVDIDVALRHTCVLAADGGVACVGRNLEGQLGRGDAGGSSSSAAPVSGLPTMAKLGAMAGNTACAISAVGELHCWGQSSPSTIAPDASTPSQGLPIKVPGVVSVAEVSGGYFSTCARLSDGGVYCWGDNSAGQIGVPPDAGASFATPTAIAGLGKALQVSASWDKYVCALIEGGRVYCWGDNQDGRLGRGEDAAALPVGATPQPVVF